MRKEVELLLHEPEVRRRVISVLESMELIKPGATTYGKVVLTNEGHEVSPLVSKEIAIKLRLLFPAGKRGNLLDIRRKMTKFMEDHEGVTEDQILKAAYLWVSQNKEYCGKAQYFFYKKEGGHEISRCEEYLELLVPEEEELGNVI